MNKIEGQVAIVTGGATGIGLAIATTLVKHGVKVMLAGRREALLATTADALNKLSQGHCAYQVTDVREKAQTQKLVQSTLDTFSRVDILINNAGLGVTDKVIDCPEENWDLVLDTCTKGTFLMSQAVLPKMQAQQSGFIINIASQAAKHGYAETGPYCAAKFGVLGLGLALQEEVREYGIKVHSLCPGLVQVPAAIGEQDATPGWLQPEDLAASVLFLLQQPKRVHFDNIGLWGVA